MASARSVEVLDEGSVLALRGELDAAGAQDVRSALSARVGQGDGDVVVDMSGLAFIDTSGLGALVKAAGQLDRAGRRLRVRGAHGPVRRAIETMGLAERVGLE